jgi:hypothetical protein
MSEVNPELSAVTEPVREPGTIIAYPSGWYRLKRMILVLVMVGYGGWFFRDGFFVYPRENQIAAKQLKDPPHSAFDVPFNKAFGIALPPIGIAFAAWTIYVSRGKYELEGETLSVPGHPSVPLSSIQTVDRRKWDRKGIALVSYTTGERSGTFKLDDFIYDREPTDEIFKRIEIAVVTPA